MLTTKRCARVGDVAAATSPKINPCSTVDPLTP